MPALGNKCPKRLQQLPNLQKRFRASTAETSPIGTRSAKEMVAAGYKRYGIEKGILYFRLDGAVKGTETIYFDHWGWREAKYINTETDLRHLPRKSQQGHLSRR
ncbi:MAG: hypothetical protein KatS3mg029_0029 [Saprospiraceae bacterium]|nr:MAG: hypothetical protein KatS3mg029_0029 [Saprospiraceae bacterium]